jgi:CubicO group peptidase (beta-lactamase class C family)
MAAPPSELSQRVDAVFADLDRTDSPGCAIGVVQDGRLVYERGYGMASLEFGVPNSPQLVYYAASISKEFVAASIVLAAQEGKLALDDDIRKYLPEIPDYGHTITIRHLVHHTSGLRDYFYLMHLAGMRVEDVHPKEEVLQLIARQKALNFRPGDEYLYSNSGYLLLSEIIGRVTGKSLREFARANIFEPLGMRHTHFHDDRKMVVAGRAAAYSRSNSGGFELNWFSNFDLVGSGGLLTTIEDLFAWDQNFYDNRLGGEGFLEQMHETGVLNDGKETDYAFGLIVTDYRGLRIVAHGGAAMGFRTNFLQFPTEHFSILALCNLGELDPGKRSVKIAEIFLGHRLADAPAEPPQPESTADPNGSAWKPAAETLQRLAGTYLSSELAATYQFEIRAGAIWFLGISGIPPAALQPITENTFSADGMEFAFSGDGSGFELRAGPMRNILFVRSP